MKMFPSIREILLKQLFFRLFLPLLVIGIAVIITLGILGMESVGNQQKEVAGSVVRMIDFHIEHGEKIINSIAMAAENPEESVLKNILSNSWRAYGYFETIYFLDSSKRIKLIEPYNANYSGLDMSNLPIFRTFDKTNIFISKPLVSVRTGEPIIYIVKMLANGTYLVGELNLSLFQIEIMNIYDRNKQNFVYILDQGGNLLAHPNIELVKEQTNLSNLKIFNIKKSKSFQIYKYNGEIVFGNARVVAKTGWIVIDQIKITDFWKQFLQILLVIMAFAVLLWKFSWAKIKNQLNTNIVSPLEQMTVQIDFIRQGDYSLLDKLGNQSAVILEFDELIKSFSEMSKTLKMRESALIEANEEMESRVILRTSELSASNEKLKEMYENIKEAQAQMIQSEKMAGLGTLVAGVAHELNNPTNYIFLSSHSLKKDLDEFKNKIISFAEEIDDETMEFFNKEFEKFQNSLKYLLEGSLRIKMIVGDLRTFSRLDEAEKKETSINQILDSSVRIAYMQYGQNVKLITAISNNYLIECYPSQLSQVFLNILVNACQAIINKSETKEDSEMEKGTVEIKIKENEKDIIIQFKDNGCGMSEEVKNKMFEPFFTTKPPGVGTGLGMSISYGIIEKHKGRFEVESEEGVGSLIKVIIPKKK